MVGYGGIFNVVDVTVWVWGCGCGYVVDARWWFCRKVKVGAVVAWVIRHQENGMCVCVCVCEEIATEWDTSQED